MEQEMKLSTDPPPPDLLWEMSYKYFQAESISEKKIHLVCAPDHA